MIRAERFCSNGKNNYEHNISFRQFPRLALSAKRSCSASMRCTLGPNLHSAFLYVGCRLTSDDHLIVAKNAYLSLERESKARSRKE
jgi:hypothetical protein